MEYDVIAKRDYYLDQLIAGRHNHLIKIVTGIRRSGKSFLLFTLFAQWLRDEGVRNDHIIEIVLDDKLNEELRDPYKILNYIYAKITDEDMHYVLIDEIQLVDDFVGVLNSLLHRKNIDVFVTGSNSRFLSKDVVTEFRGRGDEIHILPLSFSEYYATVGGDKNQCWNEYYKHGGLPQLLSLDGDKKKEEFLIQLHETVYLRDIIERCNIRDVSEFKELLRIIASDIGVPCNPNKLANTFRSVKGVNIYAGTIDSYLTYMEDAFMVEKSVRYDIKGKRYINTLSKYYFQDVGLRNAAIDFHQLEENHIMENVIYNELRNRGFRVDVGMVETRNGNSRNSLEVDFVANRGFRRYYIQSAFNMPTQEKKEQETASLKRIGDAFKRIIVVRGDIAPYYDDNGFLILGLFDFLLKPELLESL